MKTCEHSGVELPADKSLEDRVKSLANHLDWDEDSEQYHEVLKALQQVQAETEKRVRGEYENIGCIPPGTHVSVMDMKYKEVPSFTSNSAHATAPFKSAVSIPDEDTLTLKDESYGEGYEHWNGGFMHCYHWLKSQLKHVAIEPISDEELGRLAVAADGEGVALDYWQGWRDCEKRILEGK